MLKYCFLACLFASVIGQLLCAQPAGLQTNPIGVEPGKTVKLNLLGQNFKLPLKVKTTCESTLKVESAEATKAIIEITVPSNVPCGPHGIWVATDDGSSELVTFLVDDLPTVSDNAANHASGTSQELTTNVSVDGVCDGSLSDFYRVKLTKDQLLSIEVIAQGIGSNLDPVVRLLDSSGNQLLLVDDEAIGADCRFNYRSPVDGDLIIELFDSRYVAGGRYRLRVGDFPVADFAYPLAVQTGQPSKVSFVNRNAQYPNLVEVSASPTLTDTLLVSTKLPEGKSSSWSTVLTRSFPQFAEPIDGSTAAQVPQAFSAPFGLSGRLLNAGESDRFQIQGMPGQTIRFHSRTRSLGCDTALQMQLLNAAGAKVAEAAVTDADEWTFDYAFPDNGIYTLVVNDLLKRGGPSFAYYVEAIPAPFFSVALKADPNVRERFLVEEQNGAAALDLQITRFGYDDAIELSLESKDLGLRILNPIIPAKATEAKIFLVADPQWNGSSISNSGLIAKAIVPGLPSARLSTLAIRRLKTPAIPFPATWVDGSLAWSSTPRTDPFFAIEPSAPARFATSSNEHQVTLNLKRINAEFKEGVTIFPDQLPSGWSMTQAWDKDTLTLSLTRTPEAALLDKIAFIAIADFKGRGRLERIEFPVQWFDPLSIELALSDPILAGNAAKVRMVAKRSGDDPQAVSIKWTTSPDIKSPAGVLELAKEQLDAILDVSIPAETPSIGNLIIEVTAATKYLGKDVTVSKKLGPLAVIAAPQRVETFPKAIALSGPRSRQQVILTGFDETGIPRDWTRSIPWKVENSSIARFENGVAVPVGNGATNLVATVGGHTVSIPIEVTEFDVNKPIQFENEVLVALSKQSCNSGACHGSPSGKGSFRLSLRAFDPKLDQLTLIREDFGRRVNPLDAEQSLLLLKPLMKVPHGGGKHLHKSDAAYEILRQWVAQGATADPPGVARCVKLEISPTGKQILKRINGSQQLAVTASFADGNRCDVTHLVAYESSNTNVATVDANGLVTSHGRGEAAILVRFLEHIESIPLMFIDDIPGFEWKTYPSHNYIDVLVDEKLRQLQYLPSPLCTDSEFIRRVYLDVLGFLPTIEETRVFLDDTAGDKRSRLIKSLLERPEHAKFWALKWGDLLKLTGKNVGDDGVYKYYRWVEQAVRNNMPYDQFARELISGSGSTLTNPPANFYRTATDMNDCVETISQLFLGSRLQCAKCHNHPFERWTQDNYYGMGAFFQRVQRRKTQRPGEMFIWASASGEVVQPRTGETMKPWLPQQGSIEVGPDQDRRLAFAEWLVRPNNPFFARIEANRIWSQLFARGIVDPIDDFRDSNPPTNGPLLDALTKDFVESGFNRRHLIETILNSRTYQASFETNPFNEKDKFYFSHQEPRMLSAEQLLDAVNQMTGTDQQFGSLPPGTRATQLPAPDVVKVDFLRVFGQPERTTVCACERSEDTNLGMAIELFNGPLIYEKIRNPQNRFRRATAAGKSTEEAIREMYLAGLCRQPKAEELEAAMEHCKARGDVTAGLEDICWALLNTDEFLFQH